MKIVALSNADEVERRLVESRDAGYITFIYHHPDPTHKLLREKFLYVQDDSELQAKVNLIKADITVRDQLLAVV